MMYNDLRNTINSKINLKLQQKIPVKYFEFDIYYLIFTTASMLFYIVFDSNVFK